MYIKEIEISNVRIIKKINLSLNPKFNFIIGDNASGKSSLLESFTILATAKSFRTNKINEVIRHNNKSLLIIAKIDDTRIGIERNTNKKINISIDLEKNQLISKLSNHLVLQVITPSVSDLVESLPRIRRNFIDWGLFHRDNKSKELLKKFNRVLKQRNSLLKNNITDYSELLIWDKQFCLLSNKLSETRKSYLSGLIENFNLKYKKYFDFDNIEFNYVKGWPKGITLEDSLKKNFFNDSKTKRTNIGAHLSDFNIKINKRPAKEVLSRGEIKLLSLLLRLSQIDFFYKSTKIKPVLLIDDLGAELDHANKKIIIDCLSDLNIQVIITSINSSTLELSKTTDYSEFRIKNGTIY